MLPRRPRAVPVVFTDPVHEASHRSATYPTVHLAPGAPEARDSQQGLGSRATRSPSDNHHFPKYSKFEVAVLWTFSLEKSRVSSTGSTWMAPLCDGPERPWECPGYQGEATRSHRCGTPRCAHLSSPSLQMSPPFSPFFFLTTQPEFSPRASCTVPSRLPDSQPLDFPDLVTPTLVNANFISFTSWLLISLSS